VLILFPIFGPGSSSCKNPPSSEFWKVLKFLFYAVSHRVCQNVKNLFHTMKITCVENRTVFEFVEEGMEQPKHVFFVLPDFEAFSS